MAKSRPTKKPEGAIKEAESKALDIVLAMDAVGTLIEKARSRKEADKIYGAFSKLVEDRKLPNDVWDYCVDWDNCEWSKTERWKEKVKKKK
jgi:hypothetical protein